MKEQLTTESHSSWAWKAPLKIIQSQLLLRAGSAKPACPGPHTFWTPPMVVTPSHPWTACFAAWLPSQCNQKKGFLLFQSEALPLSLSLTTPERSLSHLYIDRIPKTSLLCTVQSQLAQPLLTQQMVQTPDDCGGPWLNPLQSIHVSWTEEPTSGHSPAGQALSSWQSSA